MILNVIRIVLINIFLTLSTLIPQKTLSIGLVGHPSNFLPHKAQSDAERTVSNLVFRKLFKYDEGKLVNDLVKKYTISEDKTEYTIKLKDNIYWQDGVPITSNDILYTLTLYRNLRNEIEIEKISEREVLIKLPTQNAILPSLLTFGLEPSHLRNQSGINPIGSTSYRISRIMKDGSKVQGIILQSFKKDKMYNRLAIRFYSNENDVATAYKLGEITTFPSNLNISDKSMTVKSIFFQGRYFTLTFNTEKAKLESPEVRKVLSEALNVKKMLQTINYYSNCKEALGPISRSEYTATFYHNGNSFNQSAKLTQAQKTLLNKLKVMLPNNQDGRQISAILKESWEQNLGIPLEMEYLDLDKLLDKARDGSFDVVFIGYEVTPDPDRYMFWHSTQKGNLNLARFQDLRADKALEEGRKTSKFEKRKEHYNIFQDVMYTKKPAIFIYHPGTYLYTSKQFPLPTPKKIYVPSDIINNL